MAATKLDRIERDIEKTKSKIAEMQKQLKELEAQKTEQENLQIIQLVRGMNMKPEQFAAFLRSGALQAATPPKPPGAWNLTPKKPNPQATPRTKRRPTPIPPP